VVTDSTADSPRLSVELLDADSGSPHTATSVDLAQAWETPVSPSRRAAAGWIVYDLGNKLFSTNMIANYFPVWVVAVMGGSDGQISFLNTVVMAALLVVAPWLGAISDRLPRRLPLLIATTSGCCLLTFFIGGDLRTSLALFLAANFLFQAGLVVYDALLVTVSTPENRGRIGGAGVGLGYFGSLLGIAAGYVVLGAGAAYEVVFKVTAVSFSLLALPCFFWVREPRRAVDRTSILTLARSGLADVAGTLRQARGHRDLVRFLGSRALYGQAPAAIGLFMAVYLTVQLGFDLKQRNLLLASAIVAAVAGGLFWGRIVDRIGPRGSLLRVLALWSATLAVIAATGFSLLPNDLLWLAAPLAGFSLGGIYTSDRTLLIGLAPPQLLGQFYGLYGMSGRLAGLLGPLIWGFVADVLGLGRPTALVVLLALGIVGILLLRGLPTTTSRAPRLSGTWDT
jgi:UMF1 family MFS transporter